MPLSYPEGTLAEHRACRTGGRGVRREPPRDGAGRGSRRPRAAPGGADQRSRRRSRPVGRSTRTCWTKPTRRCWTTSSCGGSTRTCSTSCRTPRTPNGWSRPSAARTSPAAGRSSPCRALPPGSGWRRSRRKPRPSVGSGSERRPSPGTVCTVAGTGYTGEDGVELAVPAAAAPAVWEAVLGTGATPAGLGARDTLRLEAAFRCTATSWARGSPRSRPASAGSWLGTSQAGSVGASPSPAERSRGVARRLRGPGGGGTSPPACRPGRARRRRARRGGDERQLLADAGPRDRAGLPPPARRGRGRGRARDAGRSGPGERVSGRRSSART